MEYILEQLINGLCQGFIFALFAIGFALIVGITGLATFTHGEVVMIGSFVVYYFLSPIYKFILQLIRRLTLYTPITLMLVHTCQM